MRRVDHRFTAMGSPCALHVYATGTERAQRAVEASVGEVIRLERKYSRYRDDSVTAQINASAGNLDGVEADDETSCLLDYASTLHSESGGLFDVTSGILRRAWDFRSGVIPAHADLDDLLERVGWHRVRWKRPRIVLPIDGMEIDFGGYVKEYAADRVATLLRARGIRHGLVDLGGDLTVIGPHPDGSAWRVGIRDPRNPEKPLGMLPLSRGAIASSGDYERFMIIDGRRYAHILDPGTGWPVEGFASVSVVASHCLLAGSATTLAMLKGSEAGAEWLDDLGLPNLRVHANGKIDGSLVRSFETNRDDSCQNPSVSGTDGPDRGSATTSGVVSGPAARSDAEMASASESKPRR